MPTGMGPRRSYGIDNYLAEREEELKKGSAKVQEINSQPISQTLGLPSRGRQKDTTKGIVISGTQPGHPGSGVGLGNKPKAPKKTASPDVIKARRAKTAARKKTTIGKAKTVTRRKGRVTKAR